MGTQAMQTDRPTKTGGSPRWWNSVRGILALVALAAIPLACFVSLFKDEELARIAIGRGRVISIYAEPEFHYEPPGYIYCEIEEGGRVTVPRRRFLGVGPERIPQGKFAAMTSADGHLVAITRGNNVDYLYNFATHQECPGPYTRLDEENATFAREAIEKLKSGGRDLRCEMLVDYELWKRRQQLQSQPPPGG